MLTVGLAIVLFILAWYFLAFKAIVDIGRILHRLGFFLPLLWIFLTVSLMNDSSLGIRILWNILGFFLILWGIKKLVEFFVSLFDHNFTTFYKKYKLKKIGRYPGQIDLEEVFPQLINNIAYNAIYTHCRDDDEKDDFLDDWDDYLLDLQQKVFLNPDIQPKELYFSFDDWFEINKRWEDTSYHVLYFQKQASDYHRNYNNFGQQNDERKNSDSYKQKESERKYKWFQGISNFDELKKRYKDLLKIYHPDNQAGDTSASQEIQEEFEDILKARNWG